MTASTPLSAPAGCPPLTDPTDQLRAPVRAFLGARAAVLRSSLPPRPASGLGRYAWWRSLDVDQARRAELLDRLDALRGHLDGAPALGLNPADPLPAAALEGADGPADGITDEQLAALIAVYRARATQGEDGAASDAGSPSP